MDVQTQAHILKLLSHPTRLQILQVLATGPSCVQNLNELLDCSQPNLSQHMKALKDAGLVDCRKEGAKRCYFICRPTLAAGLLTLLNKQHDYQLLRRFTAKPKNTESPK